MDLPRDIEEVGGWSDRSRQGKADLPELLFEAQWHERWQSLDDEQDIVLDVCWDAGDVCVVNNRDHQHWTEVADGYGKIGYASQSRW